MPISVFESVAIIVVIAVCTVITRAVPFLLFGGSREVPGPIRYLGLVLPPAVMATLVIFCIKNVDFVQAPHGAAELLSIAVVVALHIWKRNNLLSIGLGTALYMFLVQVIFI